MITLDTKLYRVNRDSRYGDLKTHLFLVYDIHTIIKNDGYTFIFQQETLYSFLIQKFCRNLFKIYKKCL